MRSRSISSAAASTYQRQGSVRFVPATIIARL
jgi:hypothetical protein